MSTRRALRRGAGIVSVIAVVNAVVAGSAASSTPRTTLHLPAPLHVVSHVVGTVQPAAGHTVISSRLSKPHTGHILGSAVWTCVNTSDSKVLKCTSGFALAKGILLAKETVNARAGTVSGKVISGSGEYAGIGGTIRGTALANGVVKFTIYYSAN